jgi:hypothetical protein
MQTQHIFFLKLLFHVGIESLDNIILNYFVCNLFVFAIQILQGLLHIRQKDLMRWTL